jgi:PST family polysaccharide transporter
MGMERMQYITIPTLLGRIIFVMLAFIFIRRSTDSFLFLFFMGIGNIIAALLSIYLAFRIYKLKMIQPGRREILNNLKNGWQITASNLSITSCQYIGIFILRISSGSDVLVGYYGIAEKIYFAIKLMVNVFTQVVYPQVCQMMQKGKEQVISLFRQIYLPFLLFVFVGCVGVFLFSSEILYVFIGHKHEETSFYLKIFCVAVIIVCLNIPAALVLLADNHKKSYLRVFAIATVVHLTGNILLAHYFQAIGTVIAVIITELFITIALYWEAYNVFFSRKEKLIST